MRNIILD